MASYRPFARWRGLALEDVTLTDGFWAARQKTNHQVSLGHGFQMLTQAGNFNNLRLAGGESVGSYQGPVFMDSDVYKWLEAVAYAATAGLSRELQDQAEQAIRLVQAAQAADGYLDSYYQVVAPELKWQGLNTGRAVLRGSFDPGRGCLAAPWRRRPLADCRATPCRPHADDFRSG